MGIEQIIYEKFYHFLGVKVTPIKFSDENISIYLNQSNFISDLLIERKTRRLGICLYAHLVSIRISTLLYFFIDIGGRSQMKYQVFLS